MDDILLANNDIGLLHETKKFLAKNFKMKDMDEAAFVIGIKKFWDLKQGLGLSLKSYIDRVLKRFGMKDCSLVDVP